MRGSTEKTRTYSSGRGSYLAVLVVLRSVAGAAELVGGLVPGNNASQVSANSVDSKALESLVIVDDEVGSITLSMLSDRQSSFFSLLRILPLLPSSLFPVPPDLNLLESLLVTILLPTLRPWTRERSPGPWVLSQFSILTSLPRASLAIVPGRRTAVKPPPPYMMLRNAYHHRHRQTWQGRGRR